MLDPKAIQDYARDRGPRELLTLFAMAIAGLANYWESLDTRKSEAYRALARKLLALSKETPHVGP